MTWGHYDAIISYLHCSSLKSFYGGTLEYVIRYEDTAPKSCYLHCDYANSGTVSSYSKDLYRKFDAIICVSESVRKQFTTILPEMSNRAYTISNPINSNEILALSRYEPYQYDMRYLNCLTVARLSAEKGVDRFIRVIKRVGNMQIRYYIVGEGSFRPQIEQAIAECDLKSQVFLLGESENPYRYMIGADVLIVPSYHEAAPVVFQEAMILGLPVFTTRTLSAEEMIPNTCGFIVDNNENAMTEMLNKNHM